ncbi:MAG TPA: hypothetical protein VEU28_08635 [Actinomycetota bacterium]|nr:hypothetical protein [Actinomycetota bacterium]
MSSLPTSLKTLPPDGTDLDDLIGDLQSEYGVPTTPQEYRLIIKVPAPEEPTDPSLEVKPPAPARAEPQPEAEPSPASDEGQTRQRPSRRRRRGRRRAGGAATLEGEGVELGGADDDLEDLAN